MNLPNEQILTLLLLIAANVALSIFFLKKAVKSIKNIRKVLKGNKEYKNRKKDLEKWKSEGNHHDWIKTTIQHPKKGLTETYVCKETGYIPELDSFANKREVEQLVQKLDRHERFEKFKEQEMNRISKERSIDREVLEELTLEIFSMKKNFALSEMKTLIDELREKGSNVFFG